MWTEHRFLSFDATPIFYRHAQPDGPARAAAIIVHGMGEHGGRYAHLADYLARLGVECAAPDLRGFGRSGGARAGARSLSTFHRDLSALERHFSKETRDIPLFFIGHSFGGLITASYLATGKSKAKGLVLTSPLFGVAIRVPLWQRVLGFLLSGLAPGFSQPTRVDPKLLTHDAEILAAYGKDPLIFHRITASLYSVIVRGMASRRSIAESLAVPVLALQAGQDAVVSREATERFYSELKVTDRELGIYEECYHEILNETQRDQIFSRIGVWILHRADTL